MAGGSGTRLWPRSRGSQPKQFLDLTGDLTMLQEAQERLMPLIPPERVLVATNADYVQVAARQLPAANGFEVYQVARFEEKPPLARAEEFVRSGNYTWNSGMFVWRVERILEEMQRHTPALYGSLAEIESSLGTPEAAATLSRVWP